MSEVRSPFPRLPHAAPFLLVDRVLEIGERSGVFVKHVAASDPCVADDGTLPTAFLFLPEIPNLARACVQSQGRLLHLPFEQVELRSVIEA